MEQVHTLALGAASSLANHTSRGAETSNQVLRSHSLIAIDNQCAARPEMGLRRQIHRHGPRTSTTVVAMCVPETPRDTLQAESGAAMRARGIMSAPPCLPCWCTAVDRKQADSATKTGRRFMPYPDPNRKPRASRSASAGRVAAVHCSERIAGARPSRSMPIASRTQS